MESTTESELRDRVNSRLDELVSKFYQEVPWATHFLRGDKTNLAYYRLGSSKSRRRAS